MILVTGGSGLVGSHLLFDLINSGKKVRVLKREKTSIDLVKKIFAYYTPNSASLLDSIEWVTGDITDIYSLYDVLDGVDYVYHTAGFVSFNSSDKQEIMKVNATGTANVVNACLHKNVKKLCHVSSIATLGRENNNGIMNEETHWISSNKNSVYAVSKYNAEREVWRGTAEGLPAVIINPSIIIGPGNWDKGSSQLFKQVWDGLKFYTHGVNGYVDVRDVSKCMIQLMNHPIENSNFIVSSENIDYFTLFSMIAKNLNKKAPSIKVTSFLSEIAWRTEKAKFLLTGKAPLITKETARTAFQKYYFSNEKIKKILDFEFIPISESIHQTSRFFLRELA